MSAWQDPRTLNCSDTGLYVAVSIIIALAMGVTFTKACKMSSNIGDNMIIHSPLIMIAHFGLVTLQLFSFIVTVLIVSQ